MPLAAFKLAQAARVTGKPAAQFGAGTEAVLAGAGYAAVEIATSAAPGGLTTSPQALLSLSLLEVLVRAEILVGIVARIILVAAQPPAVFGRCCPREILVAAAPAGGVLWVFAAVIIVDHGLAEARGHGLGRRIPALAWWPNSDWMPWNNNAPPAIPAAVVTRRPSAGTRGPSRHPMATTKPPGAAIGCE